jgi:tetratricopeptide (TPR) repeat protein
MARKTNDIERFWQELKRRKTGKVIVAYAATAFILLQLADILTPALSLPPWTTTLITLLLALGFPLAVIFSWIFDITLEGIKKTESIEESEKKETIRKPTKRRIIISNLIIAALLIVVGILAYPKIFKRNMLEKLRSSGERISVAVMPFQNMTGDTTKKFWQEMIQDNLITLLSNSEELKVRQTESINHLIQSKGLTNYASITPSIASNISQKLDANIFIYGSIKEIGSTIRLNAQLTDSKTQDVFKSFQVDGTTDKIIPTIDSLSVQVKNFLIISKLKREITSDMQPIIGSTNSPEAYRYLVLANNAGVKRDWSKAREFLLQAIKIDSNNLAITIALSWSYSNQGMFEEGEKYCLKAYNKRDQMSEYLKTYVDYLYANYFKTPKEMIKCLIQLLDIDDQSPFLYTELGWNYDRLYQYDKAIQALEKSLEIYNKWGTKPYWDFSYTILADAYHKTGRFDLEKELYKKAQQDYPDDPWLILLQATLSLTENDTIEAKRYIDKYISTSTDNSASEADMKTDLANIYAEAGILDKAEEYLRQALSLESENTFRLNNLAYFLINKDRNINEGLELVEKALALSPDNFDYLDTKGWGLYMQGKYREALDIIQKSWDLRRKYSFYNHDAFLHLEAAKKAVADQNQVK